MIRNKFIALSILALLVAGTVMFAVFHSALGPVLTLVGVLFYFVFNKKK